ncbi:MAG TPA: helix-turn-helix domain-containing protein [Puia sp.]|nr:helix-turn-helix domain-containing protein [Puia sp.]
MKKLILPNDKKTPAFQMQALEAMDEPGTFHEGIPRKLSGFEFIWIKKGRVSLTVDFQEYVFSENVIYCLSPGQFRAIKTESSLQGYYICLSSDFYFSVTGEVDYFYSFDRVNGGKNITVLMPEAEVLYDLDDIIQLMWKEYLRNALTRLDILSGFLKLFTLYISKSPAVNSWHPKHNERTGKVMDFLDLVKKNFLTKRMVADYAREMSLSPSYLNYIVKEISGFSASYHIQEHVILEAKRQIFSGKRRMKELAHYLGFDDCAHFSKYFKKKCGINFSSFRKGFIISGSRLQPPKQ